MKPYAATTLAISLVLSASAFAQTVGVTVTNGDSQDLYVAVSDQNQSGQIVDNRRLNQGSSTAPLAVTADGNSKGSIVWDHQYAAGVLLRKCVRIGGPGANHRQ